MLVDTATEAVVVVMEAESRSNVVIDVGCMDDVVVVVFGVQHDVMAAIMGGTSHDNTGAEFSTDIMLHDDEEMAEESNDDSMGIPNDDVPSTQC